MAQTNPTASLIIIGNEILSGRTKDTNLNYIAKELGAIGVIFAEVRVIPDIEQKIIDTVNELRNIYDYVFTTGGIGPTHDDITTASIAKALGLNLARSKDVAEKLRHYYEGSNRELNEARLKMADFPEGAEFLANPISAAPGFKIGNVFVMAGIPNVMQAMFATVITYLKHGQQILCAEVSAYVGESAIAAQLTKLQEKYPEVQIGSYPFVRDIRFGTSIVMRSTSTESLELSRKEVYALLQANGEVIN
jgi:molybdenum cofactor synthesis domain-containing protein